MNKPALRHRVTLGVRRVVAVALTAVLGACGEGGGTVEIDGRPNLLLIVADDLGYTDLGAYGGEIRTPNIDALAAEGLLFSQFHTAPQCAPTRAMLLSGNNNHVAGLTPASSRPPQVEAHLSDRIAPLPRVLRDAGYHTYMVGKWHLGSEADHSPANAGFERSFALAHGAANHFNSRGLSAAGSLYREDGIEVEYPEGAYTTELFTDRLIDFIDSGREDGRPFFALASYTSPHWPLQVPDEYLDRYAGEYDAGYGALRVDRFEAAKRLGVIPEFSALPPRDPAVRAWADLDEQARRVEARKMELLAAMVENLDEHVGRLIQHLKESGEYENTLIVFMSDNGANSADHFASGPNAPFLRAHYDNALANMGKATSWVSIGPEWAEASTAPFSRYKRYTRQGGIVSPLIVSGPGVVHGGQIATTYVTVMDLAPTLIDVGGASYPVDGSVVPMLGESMVGVLQGGTPEVHDESYTTILLHGGRAFLRRGKWKLVTLEPPFAESKFELFDVETDPGETMDLKLVEPARFDGMIELWRTTSQEVGVVLPSEQVGR